MTYAEKFINAQRQIAYKQGQKAHGNQVAKQQAQVRKNRSAEGADTSKGKVHFEGDRAKLNKTQRASLDAMEVLAKALGVQIYVESFEGIENANKNGWYDPKDGSIHININAGAGSKGTMLFTVSHELTHFIRQWSPAKFEVLANFLVKQYGEQGVPVSDLIDAQIADAKADNRDLSREEALEEVVADSMESMLADGSVIEMMAELKQQDKGLWQKIKDWFKDLAGKIQAVVDAYKGVQPDSVEGRMVTDMKGMISTMEALYMDALVDASENFDAGAQKITTEDSGGVKYSFKGYADDGKGIYESNFPKGTPKKAKGERILEYIQNVWSKKPITLRIEQNGTVRYIEAQFDPTFSEDKNVRTDASKLMGGNRHGNAVEQRVTLDLADDYYQIAEEAQYNYSKDETGKNSETHKDVKVWHYFVNDIYFAEQGSDELIPFTVSINVKEKENGNFFYSFSAEKTEGTPTRRTLHADVNDGDNAIANGSSSNASIRNPNEIVNKKFSNRDSDGNQLSSVQQEYFKDSKERDNQGRLRVMYRGDSTEVTVFDRKKSSYSNLYGRGFYFTSSASHAGQYGQATAYYLNITNPVSTTDCTITKEQMQKFLEAVAENEDDYSFENYGYGATVESVLEGLYSGKSDFAMLYDVSQTAIGDMVEAVELFNKTNGTNYDGFILDTETVIFNSNQTKRADNRNPTTNPDTRYSQRDVGRQEAVTQALEKENAKLREDVAELRELVSLQRQVTNGTKFTKTSVEAAAISLKQSANAKGDTKGFAKLLNGLYEYIASTKELTWEGVKEQAQGAVDWLWEHIDRRGKRSDYAWENNCHGGSLAAYR